MRREQPNKKNHKPQTKKTSNPDHTNSLSEGRLLVPRSDGTGGQSRIRREQLKQKTNTPRTGIINTKQKTKKNNPA